MHHESSYELFRLIHAMNKGEKRFFKLYVRMRSPHIDKINYLRLFDIIEKQQTYNEEKLERIEIVKKQHLPMLKNYLYNLILESMRVSRIKAKDTDSRLKSMLENMLILQNKGLEFEQMKLLDKIKKLAIKDERWGVAIEVMFIESQKISQKINLDNKTWDNLEKEMSTLLKKMENVLQYQKIVHSLNKVVNFSGILQRTEQGSALKKIAVNSLLDDDRKALSIKAKVSYYYALFLFHLLQNDFRSCEKILIPYLRLLESQQTDYEITYLQTLYRLAFVQDCLGKRKESIDTLEKTRSVIWKMKNIPEELIHQHYMNETHFCLVNGEFEEGVNLIKDSGLEKKIGKSSSDSRFYMLLIFNLSCLSFGKGDYKSALKWANHLLGQLNTHKNEFINIQSWTRIMLILIHYELNNSEILPHLILSTYRFLLKKKRLFKFEQNILTFLRGLGKKDFSHKHLIIAFSKFRDNLVRITKESKEEKDSFYFDIVSWLESKIENTSFTQVVKRKIQMKPE